MASGDQDFLNLLEQIHAALPVEGSTFPWQRIPRQQDGSRSRMCIGTKIILAKSRSESDQLAVMMYDTGVHVPKIYEHIMADWTSEVLL